MPICSSPAYPFDSHQYIFAAKSWVSILSNICILHIFYLESQNTYYIHFFYENTRADTWMRVSVWLLIGVFVYLIYGRNHSSLQHAVYVPASHVDEIYRSSEESLPMEH